MSDSLNLKGLRILNTRPQPQNQLLSAAIEKSNGISLELPALVIESFSGWFSSMPDLKTINQVIFISANAVNHFLAKIQQEAISWPQDILVSAIGKASAEACKRWGISVDQIPDIADSEHLLQLENFQNVAKQNILLIKGEEGRTAIRDMLCDRGAHLKEVSVYRRILPSYPSNKIKAILQDNTVDIILFTSQKALENVFTLFNAEGRGWLCEKPCLVLSNRLAEIAKSFGIKTVLVSRYDTLLESLNNYVNSKQ